MTKEKAIEIVNKTRCSNPFTMGLNIDEYIKGFIRRYAIITGRIIPHDIVEVAKVIQAL